MRTFLGFGTNPISSKANQSKLTKQTVTNHTRNSDKCGCHLSENVDDWTWKIQNLFREKSSTPAPKHANVKDWVWQMQKGQTRKANQSKLCEGSRSVICHMLHVTCIYLIITLTEKMMGHNHFDDQFMSKLSITSTSWPNCWVEYKVEYKVEYRFWYSSNVKRRTTF